MPRQKQPIALQQLAFDSLVRHVVDYCHSFRRKNWDSTELYQAVGVFKHHLRDHVPGIIFARFCEHFLYLFEARLCTPGYNDRPASHKKAVLEMIMDVEMVGLTLTGTILQFVENDDAHRIKGLRKLKWIGRGCGDPRAMSRSIKHYCLQDLTTFIYPRYCTDLDLEIVGLHCSKLKVLEIQESVKVTDRGLRALRPCSELRVIQFSCRSAVSADGVNELLDSHKKLEQFNVYDCFESAEETFHYGFDILSRPISLVCPSLKRFTLIIDDRSDVTNTHLHSVVALFPNLTYLGIYSEITGDLRILRDLKSLAELEIAMYPRGYSMENLKELLTMIGANISRLNIDSHVGGTTQNDLNFIHEVCINVEVLSFHYLPKLPEGKLIVPSFQKLKHLDCYLLPRRRASIDFHIELTFCKMLSLESLRIQRFANIFQLIESMMLDNVKFPNLKDVRTLLNADKQADRIINIAKNNNLDFTIRSSY